MSHLQTRSQPPLDRTALPDRRSGALPSKVRGESKPRKRRSLEEWFRDDVWYLHAMIAACFGLLVLVLVHRKMSRQKGKWGRNLSLKNVYMYSPTEKSPSSSESKGEVECRKFLETVFQAPFPKARPDFLKNPVTGNNLEIDCFNPTLRLGVEYNGQQHYSYNSFFHRNIDASTNQKYRDEIKRRLCQENDVHLVEVPFTIKLHDIGSFLYNKLKDIGYL
jgi:hypothetical protein